MSEMPPGTTLRIELRSDYRGSELRADVTAEQDAVHARVWLDGVHAKAGKWEVLHTPAIN